MDPASTAALAQRILDTHHALLHAELPRLRHALRRAPPALAIPFAQLTVLLEDHLGKEEGILFPRILALAGEGGGAGCGLGGPITQMHAEHGAIRELERAVREAAPLAGEHAPALLALLDDLVIHARTEDEDLFPAALALAGEEVVFVEAPRPPVARPPRPSVAPPRSLGRRALRAVLGWATHRGEA